MVDWRQEEVVASDVPETARALRRQLVLAVLYLVAGAVIFVPAVLILDHVGGNSERLWTEGRRIDGVVTEGFRSDWLGSGNPTIEVRFELDGRVRHETIRLDSDLESFERGQRLDVLVDRRDSEHVTIDGHTNSSRDFDLVIGAPLAAGLGLLVLGSIAAPRWIRWRVQLRRSPWVASRITCHGEIGPMHRQVISANGRDGVEAYFCVAVTTPGRLAALCEGPIWVVANSRRRIVVAVDDGAVLFDCFLPLTRWRRRRMARRIERGR